MGAQKNVHQNNAHQELCADSPIFHGWNFAHQCFLPITFFYSNLTWLNITCSQYRDFISMEMEPYR